MLYVAYGSNINLEQMEYRCPHSKVVGVGELKNWKLVFSFHANIMPEEGAVTPVLVWDIAPRDWAALDRYEGFPKYYIRKNVEVIIDGEKRNADVYIMSAEVNSYEPPMRSYFLTIEKGYSDNKMNLDYLYDALVESYKKDGEYYAG